ncbi:hypothetical protein BC939DRAFT_454541 [Gamsiella multidivaricata]|uniref:uncharacterized protein n=1 Tax=Gamsiella multidivaricata TaxID=101098 RepID=UPI00222035C2|nr:uncharacterized protein BC939DRAFT_454541 [Gamsiella multidivaricata]KAI7822021.1 hypothetical protein BC939DRAFT_454541 [Gamsiella multidivaricata]
MWSDRQLAGFLFCFSSFTLLASPLPAFFYRFYCIEKQQSILFLSHRVAEHVGQVHALQEANALKCGDLRCSSEVL